MSLDIEWIKFVSTQTHKEEEQKRKMQTHTSTQASALSIIFSIYRVLIFNFFLALPSAYLKCALPVKCFRGIELTKVSIYVNEKYGPISRKRYSKNMEACEKSVAKSRCFYDP